MCNKRLGVLGVVQKSMIIADQLRILGNKRGLYIHTYYVGFQIGFTNGFSNTGNLHTDSSESHSLITFSKYV